MVSGCFALVHEKACFHMKRCIGEKVLMKGHDDEKTQWFKYMMKEVFKHKFEVDEICLGNPHQCNSNRR